MPVKNTVGDEPTVKPRATPRLWPWFVFGLLFVFIGMAAFYPIAYSNERELLQSKLWQFYLANTRDLQPTETSGPRFEKLLANGLVFAIHVMSSMVAGIVALIAVSLVRRRSHNA